MAKKRTLRVKSPTPEGAINDLITNGQNDEKPPVKTEESQEGEKPVETVEKENIGGAPGQNEVSASSEAGDSDTGNPKENQEQDSTQKDNAGASNGETKEVEKKTRKPSVKNRSKARSLTIEDLKAENEDVLSGVSKSIPTDANIHLTLQTVGRALKIPLQKVVNNLLLRAIDDYGGDLEKLKEEHGSSKNVVIRKLI